MLEEISFDGVLDSLVAGIIIILATFIFNHFIKKYREHRQYIKDMESDIEFYLDKDRNISIRLDFTNMMMFYLNGMKHQQIIGYFLLLFFVVMLIVQITLTLRMDASFERNAFVFIMVGCFVYFSYLRNRTDQLIYKVEKKCFKCYSSLVPEIEEIKVKEDGRIKNDQ